jgi:hypothetical protein
MTKRGSVEIKKPKAYAKSKEDRDMDIEFQIRHCVEFGLEGEDRAAARSWSGIYSGEGNWPTRQAGERNEKNEVDFTYPARKLIRKGIYELLPTLPKMIKVTTEFGTKKAHLGELAPLTLARMIAGELVATAKGRS